MSVPLSSNMTLREVAEKLAETYVREGKDAAAFQIAVDVNDGRKLVVSVALRVDQVSDFNGMLPGVNQ